MLVCWLVSAVGRYGEQVLSKCRLVELPDRVLRKRVADDDLDGQFVFRETCGKVFTNLIRAERCTRVQGDEKDGFLAVDRVGPTDDGRLRDLRQLIRDGLDFLRVDVLPAADDHVLGAVDK